MDSFQLLSLSKKLVLFDQKVSEIRVQLFEFNEHLNLQVIENGHDTASIDQVFLKYYQMVEGLLPLLLRDEKIVSIILFRYFWA